MLTQRETDLLSVMTTADKRKFAKRLLGLLVAREEKQQKLYSMYPGTKQTWEKYDTKNNAALKELILAIDESANEIEALEQEARAAS